MRVQKDLIRGRLNIPVGIESFNYIDPALENRMITCAKPGKDAQHLWVMEIHQTFPVNEDPIGE
jgi:hypothetical protein